MRVLDIDLDFFLEEAVHYSQAGIRPDDQDYPPWPEAKTRSFLRNRLGLDVQHPIPGSVEIEHNAVFWRWDQLITEGRLTVPFEVVHVDAHADLGMGDIGFQHVFGRLLHLPLADRLDALRSERDVVKSGNFLLYALALRWISKLTYVHHTTYQPHTTDVPNYLSDAGGDRPPEFALPVFAWDYVTAGKHLSRKQVIEIEPPAKFELAAPSTFTDNGRFEFVFAAQSPCYSPKSADSLLAVLAEHIDESCFGLSGR